MSSREIRPNALRLVRLAVIASALATVPSAVDGQDAASLEIKGPWSSTCPSIDALTFFTKDPTMRKAVEKAWALSNEGASKEREVGFIAYQERRKGSSGYEYRTVIRNAVLGPATGGGEEVNMKPPIKARQYRTVMLFHTHPGPANEQGGGYNDYPSDTDIEFAFKLSIPGAIVWGSGSKWNQGDELLYGGSFQTPPNKAGTGGDPVTAKTPGAREVELEGEDPKTGKDVTKKRHFLPISHSYNKWWGWSCPKTAKVTGNTKAYVGNGQATGDRLSKRVIRPGDGPSHPALPADEGIAEGSPAAQIIDVDAIAEAMQMAGQSVSPEQLAEMQAAMQEAMANPMIGLAMNSGWEDRERVELMPLEDEPVIARASVEKTYPSFMSEGQDHVTGSSTVETTFTPVHDGDAGFAFRTEQKIKANAIGVMEGSGNPVLTRSKAMATGSAVIDGTLEVDYSGANRVDLTLNLTHTAQRTSPDPPMLLGELKPGRPLTWEPTAIVTDSNGRMVGSILRPDKVECPPNDEVNVTRQLTLPTSPEGETWTVTIDVSQQGGNYGATGPSTVPGGWTELSVVLGGRAVATLSDPNAPPTEHDPDLPVG